MKRCLLLIILSMLFLTACGSAEQEQSEVLEATEASATTESAMTWQDYYDLGVRYLSDGNYEEAIIAFTAAIEIDPKQASTYVSRGDAYVLSGESEENLSAAQADYEKAIELDDTNAQAYLGLADIYIRRGDYDTALEILQDALSKTNNDQGIADKIAEMESDSISDSSGNVRRENFYHSDSFGGYLTFNYDSNGRKSAVTSFDSNGNQTGQIDILYDENDNIIQGYSHDWSLNNTFIELVKILYEYDNAGNAIKEMWYWDNGKENTVINSYDTLNNRVRSDWYSNGTLYAYEIYSYKQNGDLSEHARYLSDGTLTLRWVNQFDDDGNYLGFVGYDAEGNITESSVIN